MKRILNIGDEFCSWKVIKCTNKKKYRYLCKCTGCGVEKEFVKYHLLNGSYSVCKTCASATIKNLSKIKHHWNTELNGVPFTKPQDFDLNRSYWFKCNNLHNFKSSLKNFSTHHCKGCEGKERDSDNKLKIYVVLRNVLSAIGEIEELEDQWIISKPLGSAIHIIEEDKFSQFKKYFNLEKEMFEYLHNLKDTKQSLLNQGFQVHEVKLENNFEKDVDKIQKLMLYLGHWF